jgi:predicted ATPase/class 3 adenylate cyclase
MALIVRSEGRRLDSFSPTGDHWLVAHELPLGSVTFLFTDVEGSTRLLHELGAEAYGRALAEHRRVLRDAFAAHGGVEVDTQGDAFFYVFPAAPSALAAADAAATALARGSIRVRIGLHTGAPHLTEEGYVGEDVHLGARIAAAAHGGQVLLSQTTRELVDRELTYLGEHRLKDFGEPVRIFQLGSGRFPPLKTISNTNLPHPASSFVGREREVREVASLLRDGVRLLTLTGPGGSGKTRLAIEAAAELVPEFKAGVFWVGLAPLRDPALVTDTIAQTVGAQDGLAEHIGERELMLLIDNLEQVVEAAPELASLVEVCANLRLLITSREVLRVRGEVEYPVPPLAEPEAVELFCARSRLVADETISELCRRLDNLPLGVELAAARTSVLSPGQIVERLSKRLDLLKGGRGIEARQQTLRTTIEWSHELLSEEEQHLFARLAVFASGCTLDAAEQVAGAELDTLQSLVDKSLVRHTNERFWMLETIREYALERLQAEDDEKVRREHAVFFLALGESACLSAESQGRERPELVRPEQDNFRAAIDWAVDHDLELAFHLAISLEQFWVMNDPFEGVRRLRALLDRTGRVSPVLRARALRVYGESTWISGDFEGGTRLTEQSLAEFERLGDKRAIAVMLHHLGVGALVAEDFPRARRLFDESLAMCRSSPNPKLEADALHKLGWVEHGEGNHERALQLFEESAVLLERVGFTWMQASAVLDIAELSHELGQTGLAEERAREGLRLSYELVNRQSIVYSLALLARFAAADGRAECAGRLWGAIEAEEARGPLGHWERERERYATALFEQGDHEFEAARSAGRRLSLDEAVEEALRDA